MALFSHNKNRRALLGKQKLFGACCTPEVEECCYSTDQPRPEPPCQECGLQMSRIIKVNGDIVGDPPTVTINTSALPATIEVSYANGNRDCSADYTQQKFTADSNSPNIIWVLEDEPIIAPGGIALFGTIVLNNTLGPGSYTASIYYKLCGDNLVYTLNILIS